MGSAASGENVSAKNADAKSVKVRVALFNVVEIVCRILPVTLPVPLILRRRQTLTPVDTQECAK